MYNYTPLIYKDLSGISRGFDSHHPLFFMQFDKIRKFSGEPCNIWVLRYFFMPIFMRILHNKCAICIIFLSRFCHDFVTKMGLLNLGPRLYFHFFLKIDLLIVRTAARFAFSCSSFMECAYTVFIT